MVETTVQIMADNIDHVCQLAGNSLHAGVGSDLDGGYGTEQSPFDMNTIADIQNLPEILQTRGDSTVDIENVMYLNFVKFLQRYFDH